MKRTTRPAKPSATLALRLDRLATRFVRQIESFTGDRDGIEIAQMQVLAAIGENAPVSASEIVILTGLHKSRVSRTVSRFASLHWVELLEDESDGRRTGLRLTRAGKREFAALSLIAGEGDRALLASLGRRRKSVLAAIEKLEALAPKAE
jgi:DNA-binding MarR family transcriptional regulator